MSERATVIAKGQLGVSSRILQNPCSSNLIDHDPLLARMLHVADIGHANGSISPVYASICTKVRAQARLLTAP
jgi:hypothetical protein